MRREHIRSATLPPLSADVSELCDLIQTVETLFKEEERGPTVRLTLSRNDEDFQFRSIAELRACTELRGELREMNLLVFSAGHQLTVGRAPGGLRSGYSVRATGPSLSWCAGAVAEVAAWAAPRRAWYGFIRRLFLIELFVGVALLLVFLTVDSLREMFDSAAFVGWMIATVATYVVTPIVDGLLPVVRVVFSRDESFLRRNSSEIAVVVSVIGVAVPLTLWCVDRFWATSDFEATSEDTAEGSV